MANNAINTRMGPVEWLMLGFLSVLWGTSFFLIEIALTGLPPFTIVAVRVVIASAVIWLIVLALRLPVPRSGAAWTAFVVMAVLNNVVPFALIVWGQTEIESGLAAILNAATPIFTVIVAGVFLADEPVTRFKVIGSGLGLFGVAILVGPSALQGFSTNLLAQLAVLGAGLAYALAGVYGRRIAGLGVNPIAAAAGQLLAASVIMVPLALVVDGPAVLAAADISVWASVTALAVFSTSLAYVVYFRLLQSAGATNLMLVTLLIPVTAILLGSLLLGERLSSFHFAGMLVVALGLSVIDGRLWQRLWLARNRR